jgi:hypothetical protein
MIQMQAKYAYARVVFKDTVGDDRVEVIVGVSMPDQLRAGVMPIRRFYQEVRHVMTRLLYPSGLAFPSDLLGKEDDDIAWAIVEEIRRVWPSMSHFVEVGRCDAGDTEVLDYVQVYEP